jgi:hypothetical protein
VTLRIGFDMDGVLADFASAFGEVEARLFDSGPRTPAGQPEADQPGAPTDKPEGSLGGRDANAHESPRRREAVWSAIRSTPDFWTTLKPTAEGAVKRLHALTIQHRWEVFFITQRPETEGETVQRQTQRWLVAQGFDLPSVLVIAGSRGAAAAALRLDYHVDDSPQNCLDVMTDCGARAILITAQDSNPASNRVKKLSIAVAPDILACLDILEQATIAQNNPGVLRRLAALVGWRS